MIAINPKQVKEVEIDGTKFKIGIIPFGKKIEIQSAAFASKDKDSPKEVEDLFVRNYQWVKWGIKGHSGLKFSDGSDVPFTTTKEKLDEKEYDVVSSETMEVYAADLGTLTKICQAVTEVNFLKEQEAKN